MADSMDEFKIAAKVIKAAESGEIKLSDVCDQYSKSARKARKEILPLYANIEIIKGHSPAQSKMGAFIASPLGARQMAFTAKVSLNESGNALVKGRTEDEIVKVLRES